MVEVTETEYETVEREVQKYKCEKCGNVVEGDNIHTQMIFEGDQPRGTGNVPDDRSHVCEDCQPIGKKIEVQDRVDLLEVRWDAITYRFNYILSVVAYFFGMFTATSATTLVLADGGVIDTGGLLILSITFGLLAIGLSLYYMAEFSDNDW